MGCRDLTTRQGTRIVAPTVAAGRHDLSRVLYIYCTNPTMHQSHIPQCTFCNRNVHISVTKWCIVGYMYNALWDLRDGSFMLFHWHGGNAYLGANEARWMIFINDYMCYPELCSRQNKIKCKTLTVTNGLVVWGCPALWYILPTFLFLWNNNKVKWKCPAVI